MAYYKPTLRRTSKTQPGKYYPTAASIGRVSTEELCDEIAEISTVSSIDVVAMQEGRSTFSMATGASAILSITNTITPSHQLLSTKIMKQTLTPAKPGFSPSTARRWRATVASNHFRQDYISSMAKSK